MTEEHSKRSWLSLAIRAYKGMIFCVAALLPFAGIFYLDRFVQPDLVYRDLLAHSLIYLAASLLAAFIAFVAARNYRTSGEPFLKELARALVAGSILIAPQALLAYTSAEHTFSFLVFGAAGRLAIAAYLFKALLSYRLPRPDDSPRVGEADWWKFAGALAVVDLVLAALSWPQPLDFEFVNYVETAAFSVYFLTVLLAIKRRVQGPLIWFYLVSLVIFAESSVAFVLSRPWNHLWWYAHCLFAAGFLSLGIAVVRASAKAGSFLSPFGEAELYERLMVRTKELEAKNDELNQVNVTLSTLRDQAVETSNFKSEFLSNMSHEIRTPLSAVIGMTELLRHTELNEEQRDYVDVTKEAGEAVLTVINDILDLSKIEAGKLTLDAQDADIRSIVEGVCEIMGVRAQEKRLELASFIAPSVPRLLRVDPVRVRQILLNLIGNAIKFTPQGEVVVEATCKSGSESEVVLMVTVSDTGVGMKPEAAERLFKPFFQADDSIPRTYGGTGLGLAISKHLCDLMGAELSVESQKDKGSVFTFVLPCNSVDAEPMSLAGAEKLSGLRVLIVDANATCSRIIKDYLSSWQVGSMTVKLASEALSLLLAEKEKIDIVFVDSSLTDMDGLALGQKILAHEKLRRLPLILSGGIEDGGRKEAALRAGFAAYVKKPLKRNQLLDALLQAVSPAVPEVPPAAVAAGEEKTDTAEQLVLVAEDNPMVQEVVRLQLLRLGITARLVSNGREAVDEITRANYKLLFMDCQMPEMDGLEATTLIRKAERESGRKPVPIVGLTGQVQPEDRRMCLASGMDDFMCKPAGIDQLAAALQKWTGMSVTIPSDAVSGNKAQSFAPSGERRRDTDPKLALATADKRAQNPVLGSDEPETVDFERLKQQCGAEVVNDILSGALNELSQCLVKLESASAKGQAPQTQKAAHHLRGLCATLGAMRMAATCRQIEDAARAADLSGTGQMLVDLKKSYSQVEASINAYLGQSGR